MKATEKRLADILRGIDFSAERLQAGMTIRSLTADSRKVEQGGLFVCVRGLAVDGHDYVATAVARGAVAIVANRERRATLNPGDDLAVIWVDDTRKVIGDLAAAFYEYPARGLTLIGLTGTNGKTTTSFILEAIIRAAGGSPGVIGTINYRYAGREVPATFTTPEPVELQRLLREMADHRVTHVIMEVSSHALAMHRTGGLLFNAALFTNLTRDHLDFHVDMESYYQAKKRLFTEYLDEQAAAVILLGEDADGADPDWGQRLHAEIKALRTATTDKVLACGLGPGHDISVHDPVFGRVRTTATIRIMGQELAIATNLVGSFNLKNILGAVGIAVALGLDPLGISRALSLPIRVPGQLEAVTMDDDRGLPAVFVDYAHTPDALENVLSTLRQLQPKRLVVVFGCGGDRDPGKRRMMGEIAGRLADVAIVTADNSRSESTEAIMAEIERGVVASGMKPLTGTLRSATGYTAIAARGEAIALAIDLARDQDIVLISGKGHETYQITPTGTVFFDDRLEAARHLRARLRSRAGTRLNPLRKTMRKGGARGRSAKTSVQSASKGGFGYGLATLQSPSWTLDQILAATGGAIQSSPDTVQAPLEGCSRKSADGSVAFRGISTDSRTIHPGDVFLALSGEKFDGLTFATQAISRGACAIIAERSVEPAPPLPVVLVREALRALGELARYRRAQMRHLKVVAITGSSGKTTTKEMTAAILSLCGRTLKTQGNFNNLIGLPLSLLPVNDHHAFAVLEMGMNTPGEIARLTEIADPDVACINNIQPAHLAGLGGIEGVARAKGELFTGCRASAVLAVNLEDPLVRRMARRLKQQQIGFGFRREAIVRATRIVSRGGEGTTFTLHVAGEQARVRLRTYGRHNVQNALAAAAISYAAGARIAAIAAGLESFAPGENRFGLRSLPCGLQVINDSYNANPASMRAALETVAMLRKDERMVAVLGEMLELGTASGEAHAGLGALVAGLGFDYLCAVGEHARAMVKAAQQGGMTADTAREFKAKEEVATFIKGLLASGRLRSGDLILVKGSRGMRMEQVIAALEG